MTNELGPTLGAGMEKAVSDHVHEWVVFSTALTEGWLMLQCVECGQHAAVEDPSADEWSDAFQSPSSPYRWHDESRVRIMLHVGQKPLYVVRTLPGPTCECYDRRGVAQPVEYERMPVEILRAVARIPDHEQEELEELAELVAKSDLCSFAFPHFLQSYADTTRCRPCNAVLEIARRIEAIDHKGLHCSPAVVAKVLREYAGSRLRGPSKQRR